MGFKGALGRKVGLGSKSGPAAPPVAPAAHVAAAPPTPVAVPWDATRFKIQLKMAKGRMEIQRGKKENEIDSTRRQIAEHLNAGKDPLAKILCERVLRERSLVASFDIMTTYIELLSSSHTVFSAQRDFDSASTDIKESVATVVYASSRMNLPELHQVSAMFGAHFGSHVIDPIGRREGNNVQYINKLLAAELEGGSPDGYLILEEMGRIAREYNLSWIPPPEPEAFNFGGGHGGFGGAGGGANPGPGGGGGGGNPYYNPAPHASAPPPVDYGSGAPMNIPGPSYSNPAGMGAPGGAPGAPFDPAGTAPGTLYPFAPSFEPYGGDVSAGGAPSAAPSAPPASIVHLSVPPGGFNPPGPPPPGAGGPPTGFNPPPPPPPAAFDDDALAQRFRDISNSRK